MNSIRTYICQFCSRHLLTSIGLLLVCQDVPIPTFSMYPARNREWHPQTESWRGKCSIWSVCNPNAIITITHWRNALAHVNHNHNQSISIRVCLSKKYGTNQPMPTKQQTGQKGCPGKRILSKVWPMVLVFRLLYTKWHWQITRRWYPGSLQRGWFFSYRAKSFLSVFRKTFLSSFICDGQIEILYFSNGVFICCLPITSICPTYFNLEMARDGLAVWYTTYT